MPIPPISEDNDRYSYILAFAQEGSGFIEGGANDTLLGSDGNDILTAKKGYLTLDGDYGNDTITGSDSKDTILGGYGSNTIFAKGGDDYIEPLTSYGDGIQSVSAGNGNDSIYLRFGYGEGTIHGDAGNDSFTVEGGNYEVHGDNGDDTFLIGPELQAMKIFGDAGNDTFSILNYGDEVVTIEGGTGLDVFEGYMQNVELSGGAANDYFYGSFTNTTINAGSGEDEINTFPGGNSENMLIHMGMGNDDVSGLFKNSSLYGDTGNDHLFVDLQGENIIDGGAGNDFLYALVIDSALVTVTGGTGDDYIEIDTLYPSVDLETYIDSGNGNDFVTARGGSATMVGGYGDDDLMGDNIGSKTFYLGKDDDYAGTDAGEIDYFIFEKSLTLFNTAHIKNFTSGQDVLDFTALTAQPYLFETHAYGDGLLLGIQYNGGTELYVILEGVTSLQEGDYIL